MFNKVRENTVDEILHTYSETIVKLEKRENDLTEQVLDLKLKREKINAGIEATEKEAKRGKKAINFLGRLFEEMEKE